MWINGSELVNLFKNISIVRIVEKNKYYIYLGIYLGLIGFLKSFYLCFKVLRFKIF